MIVGVVTNLSNMLFQFCMSAIDRAASVESLLVRQVVGERRGWDVQFLHDFNNWELELVTAFLHCIVS